MNVIAYLLKEMWQERESVALIFLQVQYNTQVYSEYYSLKRASIAMKIKLKEDT